MIKLKSLLTENIISLTREDAQEVLHKIGILTSNPDLQEDYNLTQEQASQLYASIPKNGGNWEIPSWGWNAVRGEMENHVEVLRDIAADAYNAREAGQALRIAKQAKRFEKLFGLSM